MQENQTLACLGLPQMMTRSSMSALLLGAILTAEPLEFKHPRGLEGSTVNHARYNINILWSLHPALYI